MHAAACALELQSHRMVLLSLAHPHATRVVATMTATGTHVLILDDDLTPEHAQLLLSLRGLHAFSAANCQIHNAAPTVSSALIALTSLDSLNLARTNLSSPGVIDVIAPAIASLTG